MTPTSASPDVASAAPHPTRRRGGAPIWIGRVLSGLVAAFLLVDAGMKLFTLPVVVTSTRELGYPESRIVAIGLALLVSTLLYVIPRTSVLGAILLTGYLGGAVATHVRVEASAFNVLLPVIFAAMAWAGLALRDERVRLAIFAPQLGRSQP